MSLYDWKKIEWKMTGLSVRRVLEEMEKAKHKAIKRAKKYGTMPPVFTRVMKWGEDREPASVYRVLEDYIEAIDWEWKSERISKETSLKKQRKLFKNLNAIIRPCRVYFSAAAILVTRAVRRMGEELKKVRGKHWYDIRKKNAQMIEWDLRTWCRSRGYTDSDEEDMVKDCPDIRNALNGILPEGMHDFERIALWFHNRVYPIPHWWWEWWNMENGGLEVNPSVSYRQRLSKQPLGWGRGGTAVTNECYERWARHIREEKEQQEEEKWVEEMREEEIERLEELQERMRDYGSD